jgi:hypothetical protein
LVQKTAFSFEVPFLFEIFYTFEKNQIMKKLILFLAVGTISVSSLSSCKKKGCTDATAANYNSNAKKDNGSCVYKPLISINGNADVTINVGSSYSDLGAIATNKDGSSVTVTTDNQVDTSMVGTYYVTYSATNSNGTSTATRKVNVVIGKDNWLQAWTVSSACSATSFPLAGNPTITEGATAGTLNFDGMFNLYSGNVTATYNGGTITFTNQSVSSLAGTINFSGTGTMTPNGNIINVSFTYDNSTPLVGGPGSCTAVFNK